MLDIAFIKALIKKYGGAGAPGPIGPQGPAGADGAQGASGSSNWGDLVNGPTSTVEQIDASVGVTEEIVDSTVSISTDGTMVGNSDSVVPTEKAVVTYVASQTLVGPEGPQGPAGADGAQGADGEVDITVVNTFETQYPPAFSGMYVKTTSQYSADYSNFFTMNPSLSLVGSTVYNQWASNGALTNQRFHIDLGAAKCIEKVLYQNGHDSGNYTDQGAKNFTLWGSNSSADFDDTVYANDGTWVQLTTDISELSQHVNSPVPDQIIILAENTNAYRYYAFKFADCWGSSAGFMGVRRIELQTRVFSFLPVNVALTDGTFGFVKESNKLELSNDGGCVLETLSANRLLPATGKPLVALFGDSIIYGTGSTHPVSYYLQNLLQLSNVNVTVLNSGVSGNTSADLLTRIADITTSDAKYCYVSVGVNDIATSVTEEDFYININAIIDALQTANIIPILGAILPWTAATTAQAKLVTGWNQGLKNIAFVQNISFLDNTYFFGNLRGIDENVEMWDMQPLFNADNVHINDLGSTRYAHAISGALSTMILPSNVQITNLKVDNLKVKNILSTIVQITGDGEYRTRDGDPGAEGTFTTVDGKTVTVFDGLVISIETT